MGWKIFAILFAVITAASIASPNSYNSVVGIVDVAMNAPAAIGLVLMAFGINFLRREFWRGFARVYSIYSIVYVGIFTQGLYKQYAVDGKSLSIVLGAFLIFGALQLSACIGLWLYGSRNSERRDIEQHAI